MTYLYELYQKDYSEWAEKTADLLKKGQFSELDIEHLLEELASMGASEQNELESRLTVLIAYLLKCFNINSYQNVGKNSKVTAGVPRLLNNARE
jgi:hypothetical protein